MLRSFINSMRGKSAIAAEREEFAAIMGTAHTPGPSPIGVMQNPAAAMPKVTVSSENIRPQRCCVYCGHGLYAPRGVAKVRCPKCCQIVPVHDITLTGDITEEQVLTAGKITVAEEARVAAKLIATTVSIAGRVLGDVLASNVCTIEQTGKLSGNILCRHLDLRPGAELEGAIELIQG